MVTTRKPEVSAEMLTTPPQVAGKEDSVWQRDATAEAYPEYEERPDSVALTDEQKVHLKEFGLL